MDAPQHTKYRRMLSKEFMVHHIDAMRPELQKTVDTLLDEFIAKGSPADLFEDFALTVPTTVISRMLGVPYEDRDFFQERSKAKLDLTADPEVPIRAGAEMREYLDRLITEKMAHPGNRSDLISRLVTSQVVPGHMTREEALATIELLLMGGHETTANMIALGTLSLLTNPEQKDALVADPSLVRNTVEEMLRFHTIVHYNGPRVAMEDVEVAGTLITEGRGRACADHGGQSRPESIRSPRPVRHPSPRAASRRVQLWRASVPRTAACTSRIADRLHDALPAPAETAARGAARRHQVPLRRVRVWRRRIAGRVVSGTAANRLTCPRIPRGHAAIIRRQT